MPVLYRCNTPTDYICGCGKVARRLQALGIDYGEVRVAHRRRNRLEIVDLTGQDRVPVLVDGDRIIHESRRIVEHLDRKASTRR